MLLVPSAVVSEPRVTPTQEAETAQKSQPETLAVAFMRTVINAERQYKKKHNKYATSLDTLVGSGSFTKRMVKTDRGDYTVQFRGKDDGYTLVMAPKQYDAAHRSFWVNENGIVHYETDKPAGEKSPVMKQ